MSVRELLKAPGVAKVIYIYGHVMLLAFGYTASTYIALSNQDILTKITVMPVFWFTEVKLGGYGFSPFEMSLLMCATGMSQALWTLLVFPPLQRRWGTGGVLRACILYWPIFFAFPPFSNFLLRRDLTVAFWIFGPVATVIGTGVCIAFSKLCSHCCHSCITLSNSVIYSRCAIGY